jgi:ubiquinone/menaquinone biosynthesis C-methylase UbiE
MTPEMATTADQYSIEVRMEKVLALLPPGTRSVLEIGARHGLMTRELVKRVDQVTALDLSRPRFEIPGVVTVAGNVEQLQFEDNSFDCVVCTEVLEHVPDVAAAARELARVSRRHVLVGVPYSQDTRVGRTTCNHCGQVNPPWGHIHTFDEPRLAQLFSNLRTVTTEYCSENRERTNTLSVMLQDFARNPYGVYYQEEGCVACGKKMTAPENLSFVERAACSIGVRLYDLQTRFNKPRPTWIHLLMAKG